MLYEVTATIVPFPKMRAKIASWKYDKRFNATNSFRAIAIATKEVRAQQKLNKALRSAIRKGGITIRVVCLEGK